MTMKKDSFLYYIGKIDEARRTVGINSGKITDTWISALTNVRNLPIEFSRQLPFAPSCQGSDLLNRLGSDQEFMSFSRCHIFTDCNYELLRRSLGNIPSLDMEIRLTGIMMPSFEDSKDSKNSFFNILKMLN